MPTLSGTPFLKLIPKAIPSLSLSPLVFFLLSKFAVHSLLSERLYLGSVHVLDFEQVEKVFEFCDQFGDRRVTRYIM